MIIIKLEYSKYNNLKIIIVYFYIYYNINKQMILYRRDYYTIILLEWIQQMQQMGKMGLIILLKKIQIGLTKIKDL